MSGPLDFGDEPDRAGEGTEARRARPPADRPPVPPPVRPPSTARYTWIVGVVALVFVVLVTINAVGGGADVEPGGPGTGEELPPFAVPAAEARPRDDEDAQVDPSKACDVRGAGIVNVCQELDRGPVVVALFPTEAARCRAVLDQFDRVAPRARGVRFVAVGSRGDRKDLRGHEGYAVGWDRDGGLATAYGLVGCPQITFATRDGRVAETTRRELTDADLLARARRLTR